MMFTGQLSVKFSTTLSTSCLINVSDVCISEVLVTCVALLSCMLRDEVISRDMWLSQSEVLKSL